MTAPPDETLAALTCHRCGYDLRAHPADGKCPECETSVAESRRVAAIPRRPAWRDSDPRWRRRMVAGMLVLAFMPLMDVLQVSGLAARLPVPPTLFDYGNSIQALDDTLICYWGVYPPLVFCIGVVLLFSKERGRRQSRFDWTRRWGVICSYVVLLLSAAEVLVIADYVLVAITAMFLSMPPQYQPGVTEVFGKVAAIYLYYGPFPKEISIVVCASFSAVAILLACVPLFDALRSSGPKWLTIMFLTPLGLFSLMHLAQVGQDSLGGTGTAYLTAHAYGTYFWPELIVGNIPTYPRGLYATGSYNAFLVEVAKWCIVLGIAIWLSIAQFSAWRRQVKTNAA